MITMIAAIAENNAIGKDNDLLWHLPDDFKRFKKVTSGHNIIMGRKTFETFPKPLPDRIHLIITSQKDYKVDVDCCKVVHSLLEAIQISEDENPYIIGGGQVYKEAIDIADVLDITRVHATFDAEVFFPEIDMEIWKLMSSELHPKDDRHKFSFSFDRYERKTSARN